MNISELEAALRSLSQERAVAGLADLLAVWKLGPEDVSALASSFERYFGNVWLEPADLHEAAYHLWSQFQRETIAPLPGMTMNERLYMFGLFDSMLLVALRTLRHCMQRSTRSGPNNSSKPTPRRGAA